MSHVNLISWCQTRMAHFLSACNLINGILPALYDAMYTKKIQTDERDQFFTAVNIFIVKILVDIKHTAVNCYVYCELHFSIIVPCPVSKVRTSCFELANYKYVAKC